MIEHQEYGRQSNQENKLVFLPRESLKDLIIIKSKKKKMKEMKTKVGSKFLLTKVFRHFSGDQIFHPMANYSFYQPANGKELTNLHHNIALFCTEKIS